jgi:FixJ family two-component response regulator
MEEHSGRLVSVVDDDPSLRRSVRNLLTSMGFLVETFASAEAFLESVHRGRTGCLVLDLRMEGMDGLQLLRHLAVTDALIPTVILTAHGDEELRDRALQAGAAAFLAKPFHADVLLDAVKTAMGS